MVIPSMEAFWTSWSERTLRECTASAHRCQSRQTNCLGLHVFLNVVVLNSFVHVFESDTVVKPLCPVANLFCGCLCLGSWPFCVFGLLLLLAKRKSGWGICESSGWSVFLVGLLWFASISGLFRSLYKLTFTCLCSCKDRATVRLFFRPTPSWLSPSRSTCFIACCKLGLID